MARYNSIIIIIIIIIGYLLIIAATIDARFVQRYDVKNF